MNGKECVHISFSSSLHLICILMGEGGAKRKERLGCSRRYNICVD